jgi:hypothetical protein
LPAVTRWATTAILIALVLLFAVVDACLCANLSRQGFKPSVNVAPNLIFS